MDRNRVSTGLNPFTPSQKILLPFPTIIQNELVYYQQLVLCVNNSLLWTFEKRKIICLPISSTNMQNVNQNINASTEHCWDKLCYGMQWIKCFGGAVAVCQVSHQACKEDFPGHLMGSLSVTHPQSLMAHSCPENGDTYCIYTVYSEKRPFHFFSPTFLWSEYLLYVNVIYQYFFFNKFAKVPRILFLFCHYGVLSVDWWGKIKIF